MNTIDYNPGFNSTVLSSYGSGDIFIQKMDSDGNFIWAKSLGGPGPDYCNSVCTDINGNVYATGNFYSAVDFDPNAISTSLNVAALAGIFVLKLDTDGDLLWLKSFDGPVGQDDGTSITIDFNGNVYTTGFFSNTLDFNPGPATNNFTSNGNLDAFVLKMDADGNYLWNKTFGGGNTDRGHAIATDNVGNVYTFGAFHALVDFDPGPDSTILNGNGSVDGFVQKLDSNGNFVWVKAFIGGGIVGHSLAIDAGQNIYTAGYFGGGIDFDPNAGYNYISSSSFISKIFTHKMDTDGNLQWVRSFGPNSTNTFAKCTSLALDNNQNVHIGGHFNGQFDFDSGTSVALITTLGVGVPQSLFVQKMSPCPTNVATDTQIACDSYTWIDGITYSTSNNTATHTLTDVAGCDSVVTLDLMILGASSSNSINAEACNSYTSPSGNHTWSNTGIYSDTLTNFLGCDSVLTINLEILSNDTTISWTVCDSTASPSGLYTWAQSGTYSDTLINSLNCDSIITVALTVIENNASVSPLFGNVLSASTADTYQWFNCDQNDIISGQTTPTYLPDANGSYAVVTSVDGCIDTSSCFNVAPISCDINFVLIPDPSVNHNWYILSSTLGFGNFTYLWDWGDGAFSIGFYSTHTYSQPGYYNICLTVSDSLLGCTETYCDSSTYLYKTMEMVNVNVVDELPNGIEDIERLERPLIYPNPTESIVKIDLRLVVEEVVASIFNPLGELVHRSKWNNQRLLDLQLPQSPGLYFIELVTPNEKVVTLKVVKN